GMRLLARPLGDDPALVSGESGAVGAGLLHWLMRPEATPGAVGDAAAAREALGVTAGARILLISTEGATDRAVWEAATGLTLPTPPSPEPEGSPGGDAVA
ncbi:MAG: hypothetical protein K2G99_05975, partial [Desulfovibrio sp.]|nr:hypothetical protein [Desulfovibrio sp.]